MARTTLTKTVAPGGYAASGVAMTMTAADVANKNQFVSTGNEMVIAHNTGASEHNVTITSADDEYGRKEDIANEAIAAGAIRIYGPFPVIGWRQPGSQYIYLEADNVEVRFGIIQLP